jgi:hypothetical protein
MWAGIAQFLESRWGRYFLYASRPALEPTQAPAQCVTGAFPGGGGGGKRPGCDVDHPSPFSAEVKERAELYLYSISGPLYSVLG